MKAYGIQVKMVEPVKILYSKIKCVVFEESETMERFRIQTGVKQGYNLARFLYLLFLAYITRKTARNGKNGISLKFTTNLSYLDKSDDILVALENLTT